MILKLFSIFCHLLLIDLIFFVVPADLDVKMKATLLGAVFLIVRTRVTVKFTERTISLNDPYHDSCNLSILIPYCVQCEVFAGRWQGDDMLRMNP